MINEKGEQPLILVAEHQRDRATWLERTLAAEGYRCRFIRSGGTLARELAGLSNPYGTALLLILNPDLPGWSGEVLQEAVSSDICILVLSECAGENAGVDATPCNAFPMREGTIQAPWPSRPADLPPLVRLAMQWVLERRRRNDQEAQLLDELAERKVMEARLKYLVAHDELTGLANRRSLEAKVQSALHCCGNDEQNGALLYLDLDRFSLINDLEGHAHGDRLLVEVVDMLHASLDLEHVAARIGSDEFCIFIRNIGQDQAVVIAERLRRALDGFRFLASHDSYRISVSIGVFMLEANSRVRHPGDLISRAHQACYVAKSNGRNRVYFYNEQDCEVYTRQSDILWVPKLRDALADNRFFMVFQPVVRVKDGLITHYEVLLRMLDQNGGVISPADFIPVAERMGLIHHIDLWVVENAIDFLANLPADQKDVCLTINLSIYAFHEISLFSLIQKKLASTWLSPSRITFEITETATVSNHYQTRTLIARIRALGCHFALDDFGAGFSSFDYIKKFPVDYLKIDGQFIRNLLDDETDQVLVKAMISIARELGKLTVAEYVENEEVFALLRTFGVDYVQGDLLGRPRPQLLNCRTLPLAQSINAGFAVRTY